MITFLKKKREQMLLAGIWIVFAFLILIAIFSLKFLFQNLSFSLDTDSVSGVETNTEFDFKGYRDLNLQ